MKLKEAAKKVEDGIEETLTYCDFPSEHWTRIRTNNVIEQLNREIRRRTRVVGTLYYIWSTNVGVFNEKRNGLKGLLRVDGKECRLHPSKM